MQKKNSQIKLSHVQSSSSLVFQNTKSQQSSRIRHQYNLLQGKILQLFTLAKNQLQNNYDSILNKIKHIDAVSPWNQQQKYNYYTQCFKKIEAKIETKIQNITYSISSSVISAEVLSFLAADINAPRQSIQEHLCQLQLKSTLKQPRTKLSQSQAYNTNTGSSSKNFKSQIKSNVLAQLSDFSAQSFHNVKKIVLNSRRLQNLDWLAGQWQMLELLSADNKQIRQLPSFNCFKAQLLKKISLNSNQLMSIQNLQQSFLPNLQFLSLKKNHIISLNGLEQTNFPSLQKLDVSFNKLKHIQNLSQAYFPNLRQLSVEGNRIQSISPLKRAQFPQLQILNIDRNNLKQITSLKDCYFPKLKLLSFGHNTIDNIDFLVDASLRHLKGLHGQHNCIQSIDFLKNCPFQDIQQIILSNNRIVSIKVLKKLDFSCLKELDIQNNPLKDDQIFCFSKKSQDINKAKKKFPFLQV